MEKKIWFSSDTHFGHNKKFLYGPRGYESIFEHDEDIIKKWNEKASCDDEIYLLGDVMLGDNDYGLSCLKQLNGNIHIILGNHCTANRVELYKNAGDNIDVLGYATQIKIDGWHFYLSHYPTMTCNLEKDFGKHCLLNLYGHTHQKDNFYNGLPFCYHVGLDSHNNHLVSFEQVIEDIKKEVEDCKYYL